MSIERKEFYPVDEIMKEIFQRVEQLNSAGERIDYITFVPDGEPTLDINIGKVISDINVATKEFAGMTIPVNLDVDGKKKSYTIKVLSPSVSALIKKELSVEAGSGARKKNLVGNLAFRSLWCIYHIPQRQCYHLNPSVPSIGSDQLYQQHEMVLAVQHCAQTVLFEVQQHDPLRQLVC
jgi:hypothetical protein